METYGVFALSGSTITIIAIVAAVVTVIASMLLNVFHAPILFTVMGVVIAFILCAVLVATFWTLPRAWEGLFFTLLIGVVIAAIPFTAFIEWDS